MERSKLGYNYALIDLECCGTCRHHFKAYDHLCECPELNPTGKEFIYVESYGKCDLYCEDED